jgi:parvulin-like peptidyl-prolyl isomerase
MTPLRRTLIIILAFALVAPACSSGRGAEVATFAETVITERDLADLYESDSLTIDEALRATIFGLVAKAILIEGLTVDFGAELDVAEIDGVEQAMIDQMNAEQLTPSTYLGIPGAGAMMLRHNAEVAVVREVALRNLTLNPSLVDQILADPADYTTVCASHILSVLEADAEAVLDRLEAGEDFGVVADEVSTDSSPQGDLDCRLANAYVEEFAVAILEGTVGEPFGPVQSQFGYHIILVRERTEATREEVAADPRAFMTRAEVTGLWEQWISQKLQAADVQIDPRYGVWTAFGILPPSE